MTMPEMEQAFRDGAGLLLRREHPSLANTLDRALGAGLVQTVLPGVLAPAGDLSLVARARAALLLEPAAVITGEAAAALTWWPELSVETVGIASSAKRVASAGYARERRIVPPDLVLEQGGARVTNPALTVLDLIPRLGGNAIDEALRRRAATLDQMVSLLESLPARRGDRLRRSWLADSTDEPWSEAERHLQRRYRSLELPYRHATNHRVDLPDGTYRLLDLAIPDLLLGFEADGYATHGTWEAFVDDRAADASLATLSWQRIRFDAPLLMAEDDGPTRTMGAVIAARESLMRGTRPPGARVRRRA